MSDRGCSTLSGFLKGIVLGGLIGAGIGILLAPDKGEETQKVLKKKAKRVMDKAIDTWEENKDDWGEKIRDVASTIETNADDLVAFLDEGKEAAQEKVAEVQKEIKKEIKLPKILPSKEEKSDEKVLMDKKDVELARKILSRAAGRSFYRKSPRR